MNILFLTLVKITSLDERGIYTDLLREFRDKGHLISIVCPSERRDRKATKLIRADGVDILRVKTLNIQKTNIIEKGVGIVTLEYQYLRQIKKHLSNKKFDLVLYSTPPITVTKVIKYIKNRDDSFTYLLLKDIFPHNAVDMKMLTSGGLMHKLFTKKEKELYKLSDVIGCMSPANRSYVIKNNPLINEAKVEVNANSISPRANDITLVERDTIRKKYGVPLNKKVFVYGGNLGLPQGINFLLDTLDHIRHEKVFFLIVGSGTKFDMMSRWFDNNKPANAKLFSSLPKADYDVLLKACDVGMIFLHSDFTIPNFPSRLLSYLEYRLPVLAATDNVTDIGEIIEENKCGYALLSGDIKRMEEKILDFLNMNEERFNSMKNNSWNLLNRQFTVQKSYQTIIKHLTNV